jgi:hypothetical protein
VAPSSCSLRSKIAARDSRSAFLKKNKKKIEGEKKAQFDAHSLLCLRCARPFFFLRCARTKGKTTKDQFQAV